MSGPNQSFAMRLNRDVIFVESTCDLSLKKAQEDPTYQNMYKHVAAMAKAGKRVSVIAIERELADQVPDKIQAAIHNFKIQQFKLSQKKDSKSVTITVTIPDKW